MQLLAGWLLAYELKRGDDAGCLAHPQGGRAKYARGFPVGQTWNVKNVRENGSLKILSRPITETPKREAKIIT